MLSRFLGERVGNSRALLESLERYCHPPQLELLYLTEGQVGVVVVVLVVAVQ
jgi:hypothetical protein